MIQRLDVDGAHLSAVGIATCACESDTPISVVRWQTSDGVNWSRKELPRDFDLYAGRPVLFDGTWFRVDVNGLGVVTSTDKLGWHMVWPVDGIVNGGINALTGTNRGLAVVGYLAPEGAGTQNETLIVSSTDGLTWVRSMGWPGLAIGEVSDVTSSDSAIVAVGLGAGQAGDLRPYVWLSPPL